MKTKAIIEIDMPESCHDCLLRFIHTDYNEDEIIGCGYLNNDVTENTDCRHCDCPLKPVENIGNEEIRIGNTSDALSLLDEMIDKCKFQPLSKYNEIEKGMLKIAETCHLYFMPRLEAIKNALERNMI